MQSLINFKIASTRGYGQSTMFMIEIWILQEIKCNSEVKPKQANLQQWR